MRLSPSGGCGPDEGVRPLMEGTPAEGDGREGRPQGPRINGILVSGPDQTGDIAEDSRDLSRRMRRARAEIRSPAAPAASGSYRELELVSLTESSTLGAGRAVQPHAAETGRTTRLRQAKKILTTRAGRFTGTSGCMPPMIARYLRARAAGIVDRLIQSMHCGRAIPARAAGRKSKAGKHVSRRTSGCPSDGGKLRRCE